MQTSYLQIIPDLTVSESDGWDRLRPFVPPYYHHFPPFSRKKSCENDKKALKRELFAISDLNFFVF